MKKYNIGWGLTNACNMNCLFCYSKETRLTIKDASINDWIKFVDENHNQIDSINYGIFGEIVVCQIINNLICLCYLINAKFYGTVKYIEQDLQGFESNIVFSQSCLKLLKCLNISDFEFYNKIFTSILKGLEEL